MSKLLCETIKTRSVLKFKWNAVSKNQRNLIKDNYHQTQ